MRPTFMGLETAKSAIFTNQKSLDIVGHNLANVNTNGYTRQRVETASLAQPAYGSRTVARPVALAGQGVEALGVTQIRDSFLDKRFRDEYSKTAFHSEAADLLSDIQSALGDPGDITDETNVLGAIQKIWEAIDDFSAAADLDTSANIVQSAFRNAVQVLRQLDGKLENARAQQVYDMSIDVDRVNDIAQQLASLNQQVAGDPSVMLDTKNEHYRPNDLLDTRNLLLDELAGYGDISVTQEADGMVSVSFGGRDLVSRDSCASLRLNENADGTVSLRWNTSGDVVELSSGALKADVQFINGRGRNMQNPTESPEQGIPYYRDCLDTVASALAYVANHSIPEYDETAGGPKKDPVTGNVVYKVLLGAKEPTLGTVSPNDPVRAGNIALSDEWNENGVGYFIYDRTSKDFSYAQQLQQKLVGQDFSFRAYGEEFTGTFEEYVTYYSGKVGADLEFQNGRADACAKVSDDFLARRDEVSGVSTDEETADMMKFQKSYQAASRVMTTLDDLLDLVINRMGRVGL